MPINNITEPKQTTPEQKQSSSLNIESELTKKSTIYTNIKQNIIITTEDKVHRLLQNYLKKVENKKEWIAPLGILISLIIVPLTTNFKEAFSIPAQTWQAVWIIGSILVGIWFLVSSIKALIAWLSKETTIDWVIDKLKNETQGSGH